MPQVSIIVPCFNARAWILEALQSAFAQQHPDMEVIVVDDGSTDGSGEVIRGTFPSVRLIRIDHAGVSRARNVGTRASSGAYLQYLDSDDLLVEQKINRQLKALEQSGADVVYGDWQELIKDEKGQFVPGKMFCRRIEGEAEIELFSGFWAPPAAYLFRRQIVEKVGGWNERFPVIQDARFALDCALQGGRFVYAPGRVAFYRRHTEGSVSKTDRRGFLTDCFRHALEIEHWWQAHGGIGSERKRALLEGYSHVSRGSFEKYNDLFEQAYAALNRLQPGYVPSKPLLMALVSSFLGYRRAEWFALRYRRMKKLLRRNTSGVDS